MASFKDDSISVPMPEIAPFADQNLPRAIPMPELQLGDSNLPRAVPMPHYQPIPDQKSKLNALIEALQQRELGKGDNYGYSN